MEPGRIHTFFFKLTWWGWLITFILLSLAIYSPILANSFLSDDFLVIKKVCKDGKLNIDGFFRPLSDITLYFNYLLTGLNPVSYYLTNILVHGLNTYLLFQFCKWWKWTNDEKRQFYCALITALLFLTYPFHTEPVVWILGRASLLASAFGIMALTVLASSWKEVWKITGVAVCFFIAMTGYESVMVLPALVFIWLWFGKVGFRRIMVWMAVLFGVLVLHFVLRVIASGDVVGEYGAAKMSFPVAGLILKVFKTLGRFVLPPLQSVSSIIGLFLFVIITVAVLVLRLWIRLKNDKAARAFFKSQVGFFLIACLIPFVFGVSTHTSESDRFLYFPSFFFCSLVAFIVTYYFFGKPQAKLIVLSVLIYQLICLQWSLVHWRKASEAVTKLLSLVDQYSMQGKVYVVNLPEEIDGAYVFRVGFDQALLLHKQDTSAVTVISQAKRDDLIRWQGVIKVIKNTDGLFIPPFVLLQRDREGHLVAKKNSDSLNYLPVASGTLLWWNKEDWVILQLNSSK